MTVIRNSRFSEIYIPDETILHTIQLVVKPHCINLGFYEDFKVIKKLGAGA
jgi:hypothetical protein